MAGLRLATLGLLASCSFEPGSAAQGDATIHGDGTPPGDAMRDGSIDGSTSSGLQLVQQQSNYAGAAMSLAVTLATAPAPGHVLFMIGAAENGNLDSVSGGGVVTWARATKSASNANIELWYGVSTGTGAGVSIVFSKNTSKMWMHVSEWSGLLGTLDVATAGSGGQQDGATTGTAGSIDTTNARDLVLFGLADEVPATLAAPTDGTWSAMDEIDQTITQGEWFQIETATGSIAPMTSVSVGNWDAALAAFPIVP